MKVSLISHTPHAAQLLVFTKQTRLQMSVDGMAKVMAMSEADVLAELTYMANTIPSSWEFVDYVFMVEGVSRAYTHQQVRTRAASYAQQTMRVLNMNEFDYIYDDRSAEFPAKVIVDEALAKIKSCYKSLITMGVPPESARGILPTNIATNIVCKFNLRTMAELAKSRTGGRTQGEYQKVINAMCDCVIAVHPWAEQFMFSKGRDLFGDIESFAKEEWPTDLLARGRLLKIVDKMRKELT